MTRIPCLYNVVRFCPFVETGEFANVGVILFTPENQFFDFKLMLNRHARVTQFFEQLEPKVFRLTMKNVNEELTRAKDAMKGELRGTYARNLFNEIVRPRETIINFGETRAVLVEKPKTALAELYDFHVERNFVNREYQEAVLERGMRRYLHDLKIGDRFAPMTVGDETYHAKFPFVEQNGAELRAIKPLHLAHAQPNKILDHGGQWLFRLDQLKRRGNLPADLLFAVKGPGERTTARGAAKEEIVTELRGRGVVVTRFDDKQAILEFALN